jgi:CpeS-like protein
VTALLLSQTTEESLITDFFRQSVGQWRSQRRYYTLPDGKTQEMVSMIAISFLEAGAPELLKLAQMHELPPEMALVCGAEITWDSQESITGKPQSQGSTLFGVRGNVIYRDRGFATPKPITADYTFTNPQTVTLRTEYKGSTFEEELKLVGSLYRTRQTIISRAGEQQMIGQYLEKRVD